MDPLVSFLVDRTSYYMGRNSYQSGKTIEKAENFVTFGPLGPLKVVLALCSWYQIQARYVLDPVGVYIGGWDGLYGQEFISEWKNHEKSENLVISGPLGPLEVALAL